MVCQKCGSALPSEGFICKRCGTLMSEEQIKEQKQYLKENNNQYKAKLISEAYGNQARENSNNKIIGLIIILIALIIVVGVAIGVYLM